MDKQADRRDGITDADDTGMVSGEELITEAQTLLPLRPVVPSGDLHAALPPGHAAHSTIDELHAEVEAPKPSPASIEKHVGRLRALPELEATIVSWWDSPQTQRFIANVSQIGL